MSVIEAAKKIGISSSKLYQLVSARSIPHYRVGGKILLDESDIATFLAGCRVEVAVSASAVPQRRPHLKHLKLA